MEKDKKISLGISYNHKLIADKHYFGGFLNLAIDNIELLIKVFNEKFNIEKKYPRYTVFITQVFDDKISDFDYFNRINFLRQYLPVINLLSYRNRGEFRSEIGILLKSVEMLRNFYTHHYHPPLDLDPTLYHLLDELFLKVARDVKTNKMKDDKTRHLLSKSLKDDLDKLFILKQEELRKKKSEGKKVSLNHNDIENAVLNDAFNHLIYKKDQVNNHYRSKLENDTKPENGIAISQSGLIFLVGMFLHKRENTSLRSRIRGYKGNINLSKEGQIESLRNMATNWVFSNLSLKTIKQVISTTFHKETLLMQIVDELSKVPDEVYKNLDKPDQNSFIEDINEYIKTGNETESLEKSTVVHPIIRKRYEDKFNYFVLRYLDEFVDFPTLRFQVYVGNYVHNRMNKNINGTSFTTERTIKQKINVFGKLSEISELKNSKRAEFESSDLEWEFFPNPSYNFSDNNIPIFIRNDHLKELAAQYKKIRKDEREKNVDKKTNSDKQRKSQITRLIGTKTQLNAEEPVALLSLNELPSLLFEILNNKKQPNEIEEVLNNKLLERFEIVQNFKPEDNLSNAKITKKLKRSKNDEYVDFEKLAKSIENEIEITIQKLNLIKNKLIDQKNKKHTYRKRPDLFSSKELGDQATWLTNDIILFMPENVRKNWKGYQHSQLQQSLSLFEQKNEEAFNMLASHWDFDKDYSPMNGAIKDALTKHQSFHLMFQKYLSSRNDHFRYILTTLLNLKDNKSLVGKLLKQQQLFNFFSERLFRVNTIQRQKNELLANPLVFERGIFDEKPTFIKGKKLIDNPELFANWYQYANDSNHKLQEFYKIRRDYKENFNSEKTNNKSLIKNERKLSIDEQFDFFKLKQDMIIKSVKSKDLFLKLIAEDIYHKLFNNKVDFSLDKIYTSHLRRIEIQTIAEQQSSRNKGDKTENIINDSFLWSKTVPFKTANISEPEVKLKDLGKFRYFLENEKVKTIFTYHPDKIWTKLELENELFSGINSYEKIRREDIFKELHAFENFILTKNDFNGKSHPIEFERDGNPNFAQYIFNGVLRRYHLIDDAELCLLDVKNFDQIKFETYNSLSQIAKKAFLVILIRNKFSHNQLPKKSYYDEISKSIPQMGLSISETILQYLKNSINEFKMLMIP